MSIKSLSLSLYLLCNFYVIQCLQVGLSSNLFIALGNNTRQLTTNVLDWNDWDNATQFARLLFTRSVKEIIKYDDLYMFLDQIQAANLMKYATRTRHFLRRLVPFSSLTTSKYLVKAACNVLHLYPSKDVTFGLGLEIILEECGRNTLNRLLELYRDTIISKMEDFKCLHLIVDVINNPPVELVLVAGLGTFAKITKVDSLLYNISLLYQAERKKIYPGEMLVKLFLGNYRSKTGWLKLYPQHVIYLRKLFPFDKIRQAFWQGILLSTMLSISLFISTSNPNLEQVPEYMKKTIYTLVMDYFIEFEATGIAPIITQKLIEKLSVYQICVPKPENDQNEIILKKISHKVKSVPSIGMKMTDCIVRWKIYIASRHQALDLPSIFLDAESLLDFLAQYDILGLVRILPLNSALSRITCQVGKTICQTMDCFIHEARHLLYPRLKELWYQRSDGSIALLTTRFTLDNMKLPKAFCWLLISSLLVSGKLGFPLDYHSIENLYTPQGGLSYYTILSASRYFYYIPMVIFSVVKKWRSQEMMLGQLSPAIIIIIVIMICYYGYELIRKHF